jgi:hypothetical protein
MTIDHTYEEIRAATLDVLAGRETGPYDSSQYGNISINVAEVFARREGRAAGAPGSRTPFHLSAPDRELFLEVFWDLFRQGIITLGFNDSNREFPFCRLSRFGKQIADHQDTYFFHDVSSYANLITEQIPEIDPVTLLYLKEALQAFRSGCILSATVMLGVATEHTFLLVLEAAETGPRKAEFASVFKERSLLPKFNKFRRIIDAKPDMLTSDVREDLDTQFAGILSIIRGFRNESGHPTGKLISREQIYVLLNLFPPYCKKMYMLRALLAD